MTVGIVQSAGTRLRAGMDVLAVLILVRPVPSITEAVLSPTASAPQLRRVLRWAGRTLVRQALLRMTLAADQ